MAAPLTYNSPYGSSFNDAVSAKRVRGFRGEATADTNELIEQNLITISTNTVVQQRAREKDYTGSTVWKSYGKFTAELDLHTSMRDPMVAIYYDDSNDRPQPIYDAQGLPDAQSSLSGIPIYRLDTPESVAERVAFVGISYTHHDDKEGQITRNRITTAIHGFITLKNVWNPDAVRPGDDLELFLPSLSVQDQQDPVTGVVLQGRATQYAHLKHLKKFPDRVVPLFRKHGHYTFVEHVLRTQRHAHNLATVGPAGGVPATTFADIRALRPGFQIKPAPLAKDNTYRALRVLVNAVVLAHQVTNVGGGARVAAGRTLNFAGAWAAGVLGNLPEINQFYNVPAATAFVPHAQVNNVVDMLVHGPATVNDAALAGNGELEIYRFLREAYPIFLRAVADDVNTAQRLIVGRAFSYGRPDGSADTLLH